MKNFWKKYDHFVEKYKIYYFIELVICITMCVFKLVEFFHHQERLYLFPASYFFLYILFKTIIEILIHKKMAFKPLSRWTSLFMLITAIPVIGSCVAQLYFLETVKLSLILSFIVYGGYALIKGVIVVIKLYRGLKYNEEYEVIAMLYAIYGVLYTSFIFALNLIGKFNGGDIPEITVVIMTAVLGMVILTSIVLPPIVIIKELKQIDELEKKKQKEENN